MIGYCTVFYTFYSSSIYKQMEVKMRAYQKSEELIDVEELFIGLDSTIDESQSVAEDEMESYEKMYTLYTSS